MLRYTLGFLRPGAGPLDACTDRLQGDRLKKRLSPIQSNRLQQLRH